MILVKALERAQVQAHRGPMQARLCLGISQGLDRGANDCAFVPMANNKAPEPNALERPGRGNWGLGPSHFWHKEANEDGYISSE